MFEIIVNKKEKEQEIALIENGKLVEYYNDEENDMRKEGNIYIGIVKDVIKGMQSAFVDIGTEKNAFIHLKDVLHKVDEKKEKFDDKIQIKDVIKNGQKILVQVKKDSNAQKGARVSTHINLPSRYIVLMPNTNIVTISQKIEDKAEQERLKKLVKENLSKGNGAVIRTSANGKNQEIIEDIKNIEQKWNKIENAFKENKEIKPKEIAKSENILEKMIIDLPEKSIQKILTNDKNEFEKLEKYKNENIYISSTSVMFEKEDNMMQKYDIEKEISKIKNRKIWLRCGGFITIDKTEALTAIDVNTGKYTGNKNVEQTVLKVNEEATIEIAKQLRLKDIGGIIIIDYIDMNDNKNRDKIQKLLEEELKKDRSKTQIEGFTKLDLMEMTRKHICSHRE